MKDQIRTRINKEIRAVKLTPIKGVPQLPLSTNITLKPRERKFIKAYMQTGILSEAVKLAGFRTINPDQQKQVGSRLLKRLRQPVMEMMIDMGLDNISLIRVLKDGLDATITYTHLKDGVVIERTYPNYFVRHKYLDTAFKLSGLYAPLRIDQRNLNVDMSYTDFISEAHRQRDALSQDTGDRQETPEKKLPRWMRKTSAPVKKATQTS